MYDKQHQHDPRQTRHHSNALDARTIQSLRAHEHVDRSRKIDLIQKLFTPWRLKFYPRFILIGLAAGFIVAFFFGQGPMTISGRLGGDYPAFYTAGRIIAQGDGDHLYSAQKQSAVQQELLLISGSKENFAPFVNPPFLAAAYYPLSLIPYRLSYAIHTLLLVGATLLAVWLLRPLTGHTSTQFVLTFCLVLTFYPMLRAILGSQNTALSFLLIVLCWRKVQENKQWLAGVALGLLLFKPQYALPLIGLHLLSARWRVVAGSLLTALLLYGLGALVSGRYWVTEWLRYASWFAPVDAEVNANNAISWLGFFQATMGSNNAWASLVGQGLALSTAVALALLWPLGGTSQKNYTAQMGITAAFLTLMPDHAMYYDFGLVAFTGAVMAGMVGKSTWTFIGLIWFLAFSQGLSPLTVFSPLFPVVLLTSAAALRFLGKPAIQRNDQIS